MKEYTFVYFFNREKDLIESYLLSTDHFICRAACITKANTWIEREKGDQILFFRDIEGDSLSSGDIIDKLNGISFMSVNISGDEAVFHLFNGREISTVRQETYENGTLLPSTMDATDDNVETCLREWHLGLKIRRINDTVAGLEFNTPKHMYIFDITDDFIYCRAARYGVCRKGVVFSQTFRQNFHDFEGQSFVYDDSRIARNDVVISESLFDPQQCVFSDYDIYWSVLKVEKDVIVLNGCGGEIYKWGKPRS